MEHLSTIALRRLSFLSRPLALGLALLATSQAACDCAQECSGGFEWRGEASGALPAGTYAFTVELDDTTLGFDCRIEPGESSSCEDATRFQGNDDFDVDVSVSEDSGLWSSGGPSAIVLEVHGESGSPGPESVRIVVVRGDAPLLDVDYTLDYERDEASSDVCGACEPAEKRTSSL